MDNIIDIAIRREWKIFPLIHRSRFATVQPLLSKATSSIEQIEAWQQGFPDFPWAVATGETSGVFAVEFSRDLGIQTMRSHCDDDFGAMDTFQIRTRKQVTMFFPWPNAGLPVLRHEILAEGISIRQSGGYVELPEETRGTDSQYTYSDPTASIKDPPAWLLTLINKCSRSSGLPM